MARAPINYMLDIQSPVERAMRGYQFGLGEVQAEREEKRAQERFGMEQERFGMEQERFRMQRAAAAQAAAEKRAQAERQQAFYNDFSKVVNGELSRSALLAAYPDFAKTMSDTFELIPNEMAGSRVALGKRVQAALNSGNVDIATSLIMQNAEAARNSGDENYARQLDELARQAEENPRLAFEQIGLGIDAAGDDEGGLMWSGGDQTEAFRTTDLQLRAAGIVPRSEGGDGRYEEAMQGKAGLGEKGPLVQNIIGDSEGTLAKELAKDQAQSISGAIDVGASAARNLAEIDTLADVLSQAQTGAGAAVKSYLGRFGVDTEGLDVIQAAEAAINRMVPAQRPPGSGTMSDADLALFKRSLPSIINQPGGNKIIIDTLRNINEYDVARAVIAGKISDWVTTPKEDRAELEAQGLILNPSEGRKAMMEIPNPLASFSPPSRQQTEAAAGITKEQFMKNSQLDGMDDAAKELVWEKYKEIMGIK